jgi:hypothetical protein
MRLSVLLTGMPADKPSIMSTYVITGLPLNEIPPDTPNYLTDRTYVDIIEGLSAGIPVSKTLSLIGCDYIMTGRIITWFYADDDRKREYLRLVRLVY